MKNSRRRRQGADPVRRIFPLLESLAETSIDLNLPRDALVDQLANPFDFDPAAARYALPPKPEEVVRQTFCGT